jgi:hypothetical protein
MLAQVSSDACHGDPLTRAAASAASIPIPATRGGQKEAALMKRPAGQKSRSALFEINEFVDKGGAGWWWRSL